MGNLDNFKKKKENKVCGQDLSQEEINTHLFFCG